MSEGWPRSPVVWLAGLASAVFLVLWWAVDDTFVWLFLVGAFVTGGVWTWETRDWPRSPLVWIMWPTGVAFLVLWLAVDESFSWPFLVFLFLTIAVRAWEQSSLRTEHDDRSLRPR